jgi:DNA polymerase elongation subunit (family B)
MEAEKDPFIKSVRDFRQQSLKILCNAIYGALGARTGGYFLALKWLMLAVTSLGRYLQTRSSQHVAELYDLPTIYGDTDSIMPRMHTFDDQPSIELQCKKMAEFYKMPPHFNWEFVVSQFSHMDLPTQERKVQVRAALFIVMEKICKEIGNMFGKPIKLEPENIALKMWLTLNKKYYWYQCIEMKNPAKVPLT